MVTRPQSASTPRCRGSVHMRIGAVRAHLGRRGPCRGRSDERDVEASSLFVMTQARDASALGSARRFAGQRPTWDMWLAAWPAGGRRWP
eukprot:289019-Prymnesium_polylepis.1